MPSTLIAPSVQEARRRILGNFAKEIVICGVEHGTWYGLVAPRGIPFSARVGTSGGCGLRVSPVMPSTFTKSEPRTPMEDEAEENSAEMLPDIVGQATKLRAPLKYALVVRPDNADIKAAARGCDYAKMSDRAPTAVHGFRSTAKP